MNLSLGDTRLIINACKARGVLRNQCAYALATGYHETAHTMKPIYERGGKAYFNKYEPNTKIGKALGNVVKGDGYLFRGRGYVQLTGRANYVKAGRKLGIDLVRQPDLALLSQHAALIMVIGMIEGWFTGRGFGAYITATKSDFRNARRIINGTDKADLIAGYAQQYDDLLLKEGYGVTAAPPAPAKPIPAPPISAAPSAAPREPQPLPAPKPSIGKPAAAVGLLGALGLAIANWWSDLSTWFHSLF